MDLITNEEEHAWAMRMVERLMKDDPEPSTNEGMLLRSLAYFVEKYESKKYGLEY